MKKTLLLAAFVAAIAVPALAGECSQGFSCANECPLAQQANTMRSSGREAVGASASVRAAVAAQVEKSLAKV